VLKQCIRAAQLLSLLLCHIYMHCIATATHAPCRPERVTLEDGTEISRPVIRIPELNLVLTRIDPQRKETSMVFRVREGWEQLRKYMAGEADGKKRCAWRRLWLGRGCCSVLCLVLVCSTAGAHLALTQGLIRRGMLAGTIVQCTRAM
jgi:hypothetical protein